jgi:transposase-like protein
MFFSRRRPLPSHLRIPTEYIYGTRVPFPVSNAVQKLARSVGIHNRQTVFQYMRNAQLGTKAKNRSLGSYTNNNIRSNLKTIAARIGYLNSRTHTNEMREHANNLRRLKNEVSQHHPKLVGKNLATISNNIGVSRHQSNNVRVILKRLQAMRPRSNVRARNNSAHRVEVRNSKFAQNKRVANQSIVNPVWVNK